MHTHNRNIQSSREKEIKLIRGISYLYLQEITELMNLDLTTFRFFTYLRFKINKVADQFSK